MTMLSQFDSDVQAIEPELPASIRWAGKTLIGSKDSTSDSDEMADAGLIKLYDFNWVGRTALFVGIRYPAINDLVDIQDSKTKQFIEHRIDKITTSQDGVCLTLHCCQSN